MENKKIFIGNLSYDTTIERLTELFLKYGEITDSYKPEGKGFAFITYSTEEQAQNAIEAMNEQEVDGRNITVNIARPKEDRPRRSFGGGNGGGRGGFNRDRNNSRGGGRGGYNNNRY